jgi:hypothetical protein
MNDVSNNVAYVLLAGLLVVMFLIAVARGGHLKSLKIDLLKGMLKVDSESDTSHPQPPPPPLSEKPKQGRPTSISGCAEFFKEKEHHCELRVFAMSGQRFLETIRSSHISVDLVRIIAPSDEALIAYFGRNTSAIEYVKKDIDNICNGTTATKLNGLVGKVETKRIGSFPLTFYAIFSDQLAMAGVYAVDELREHTIGLKSRAWIDPDKNSVDEKISQFNALWSRA